MQARQTEPRIHSTSSTTCSALNPASSETACKIQPSYWYAGGPQRGIRSPKEAYQLSRFKKDHVLDYEEGWTERQAAQANGLYRVWDAGKTRWIKPVS